MCGCSNNHNVYNPIELPVSYENCTSCNSQNSVKVCGSCDEKEYSCGCPPKEEKKRGRSSVRGIIARCMPWLKTVDKICVGEVLATSSPNGDCINKLDGLGVLVRNMHGAKYQKVLCMPMVERHEKVIAVDGTYATVPERSIASIAGWYSHPDGGHCLRGLRGLNDGDVLRWTPTVNGWTIGQIYEAGISSTNLGVHCENSVKLVATECSDCEPSGARKNVREWKPSLTGLVRYNGTCFVIDDESGDDDADEDEYSNCRSRVSVGSGNARFESKKGGTIQATVRDDDGSNGGTVTIHCSSSATGSETIVFHQHYYNINGEDDDSIIATLNFDTECGKYYRISTFSMGEVVAHLLE